MSNNKTHWKKMTDTNYLGSWDIEEGKKVLTIKSIKEEMIKSSPSTPEEKCIVAYFETEKPMILNKTNCKAIEKRAGTAYVEDWVGIDVTIYVAKVKAFGEMHDALRIEDFEPKKKAKAKFKDGGYDKALSSVLSGKMSASKIIASYEVSEDQSKQLEEAEQSFKENNNG